MDYGRCTLFIQKAKSKISIFPVSLLKIGVIDKGDEAYYDEYEY